MKKSSAPTENAILVGIFSLMLIFALVLTGCRDIFNADEPTVGKPAAPVTAVTLGGLEDHLNSLAANTSLTPHTVALAASVYFDTTDTAPDGVWATINHTVRTAKKYVILDLSACSAEENRITGNTSPKKNHFNIISYNIYIRGIKLPSTLTDIGDYAFFECTRLTSVSIPGSVTSIGDSAFSGCTGLTSVSIPGSVTSIGSWTFDGCTGLTSVIFGMGSSINFPFDEYMFPDGVKLWVAYTSGSKAGTYIHAGSNWTQTL